MSHTEMVERVAKAIMDDTDIVSDAYARKLARIAIGTMVEPTDAMAKAGVLSDDKRTGNQTCRHIYRAMISAALAAPPAPKGETE